MNHIEMIASSLRNCSLNGGRGLRGRRARHLHQGHAEEGSDDSEGVTVELNSEVALPYHWQQCLDIRTGQVYYVNWADGTRTTVDPRTPSPHCFSTLSTKPRSISSASTTSSFGGSSYASPPSSVGTVAAAAEWFSSGATGGYGYEESDEEESSSSRSSSAISSALSSFSPTDESASSNSGSDNGHYTPGHAPGHVLVAAGCRGCFMYFMVPKSAGFCPKCGSSGLVHLNNASYA